MRGTFGEQNDDTVGKWLTTYYFFALWLSLYGPVGKQTDNSLRGRSATTVSWSENIGATNGKQLFPWTHWYKCTLYVVVFGWIIPHTLLIPRGGVMDVGLKITSTRWFVCTMYQLCICINIFHSFNERPTLVSWAGKSTDHQILTEMVSVLCHHV